MNQDSHTALREYFTKLGLEPEIAEIYLALLAYGPQYISQLARNSGIERTKLYRMIEIMRDHHLVELYEENSRSQVSAAPLSNLQVLILRREQEIRDLALELQQLHSQYTPVAIDSPVTHIQMFRGVDGMKQMFWNQTKATGLTRAIMYENLQGRTNLAYFERWVRRCNEKGLAFRGIIGDNFIETQQQWYDQHSNERLADWQARYVDASVFPITHSVITYDNVIAYYNWHQGEIFGIEVHNQEIADSHAHFFDMLWQQSRPVDDLAGLGD
jgi:sugar-specific transcriptional regulator TrmB